jgi:putative endonuclease
VTRGRQALGRRGEDQAAAWYVARGYEVIDRNWRCRDGELDLVVRRADVLVFCEVKTRSSNAFGSPAEAVTATKQRRLRRLATLWLREHGARTPRLRFDVAAVLGRDIDVIENAF